MAVGTTDTFNQTRDEIISDALINLGALAPGKTATGARRDHAVRALGRIVKSIDADGQFLWRVVRRTLSTTDGTATYTLGTDVLDVDDPMNFRRSGANGRSQIRAMSRDEFMSLADRTIEGVPTLYFLEKTLLTTVTVTFWPVPDATGDSIEYAAVLRGKDFDDGSTNADFNQKWVTCLVYGLTAELAGAYGQPQLMQQYRQMFLEEKGRQLQDEGERGNLVLVPFGGSAY